jgi:hypothetical protein
VWRAAGATVLLSCGIAALALPRPSFAQTTSTPRIDQRQENQAKRITPKEAARLKKGQERVQQKEDKAMADGTITKKEHAGRRIYKEKHDARTTK